MSPEEAALGDIPTRDAARVWAEIGRTQNWWVRLSAYEPFQIERLYRLAVISAARRRIRARA